MRKLLAVLWRVLTFPFRLVFNIITFPFRAAVRFYRFLNTEPEDRPLSEVLVDLRTDAEVRNSLWDHLEALRSHLIRAVIVFAICCLLTFRYIADILHFLQIPLTQFTDSTLRISSPGTVFDIIPQVTFSIAFILALPYIVFELWLFAAPGLRPVERKAGLLLVPLFTLFSLAGMAIAYYVFLPLTLSTAFYLTSQFGVFDWELIGYLSFTVKIMILSAIIVYYPFGVYLYSVLFHKPRIPLRIILLVSYFLAAIITPGTMVLIDFGLAVVLFLIYLPTYLAIRVLYRAPQKSDNQEAVPEMST